MEGASVGEGVFPPDNAEHAKLTMSIMNMKNRNGRIDVRIEFSSLNWILLEKSIAKIALKYKV
jgi:uncharacterized protein (DUF2141 family)